MSNLSNAPAYNKWDNTFRDAREETQFLIDKWPRNARRIRITALLTGLAYLGGAHGDYMALGHSMNFFFLLAARGLVSVIALACLGITFTKKGRAKVHVGLFLYFLVLIFSECLELIYKPELGAQGLPFLSIIIIIYYLFYPTKLIATMTGGIIGGVAYTLVQAFVLHQPLVYVSPAAITFILVNLLGIYFIRAMNRADRTEYHSLAEQRQLNQKLHGEIAEREKMELRLLELATVDELTKVFNRRRFLEIARSEFRRIERTNRNFSLLMIDADNFKVVNDTYGHDVGDLVLQTLAGICQENIRDLDVLGRIGGEEFALLLPETSRDQAGRLAERLRGLIAETPVPLAGNSIQITVSIGVASTLDNDAATLEKLFKNADKALYLAKENGRDQVAVWGSSEVGLSREVEI